uniref:Uncharacterized protein n=1 Tax=Rhizophora mucronata TaxID=61149 RepID=A0A2P2NLI8_RHIMU
MFLKPLKLKLYYCRYDVKLKNVEAGITLCLKLHLTCRTTGQSLMLKA